jgi:hypothetical protein
VCDQRLFEITVDLGSDPERALAAPKELTTFVLTDS